MGMLDKVIQPRRICPMIFLLDTSENMAGTPIWSVNTTMEYILQELKIMNKDADAEIMIAIMTFDSGVEWLTGKVLVSPENYVWNDLTVGGNTSMGAAFKELNEVLSFSHDFMTRDKSFIYPILILLSVGEATDDYQKGLQELKKNRLYRVAFKIAIACNEKSNDAVLEQFTSDSETVLHTNVLNNLRYICRYLVISGWAIPDCVIPDKNETITKNYLPNLSTDSDESFDW